MAYVDQTDLEDAIGTPAVAVFYSNGSGGINTVALAVACGRASAWVDSFLALNYRGPFPVTQDPAPAMMKEAALLWLQAIAQDRKPEFIRQEPNTVRPNFRKQAIELLDRLIAGIQQMPDHAAQPKPTNVGGIAYASGPRMLIPGVDGTDNGGDL